MNKTESAHRALCTALKANGCFSILSGLLLATFAETVAELTGISFPLWIRLTGLGLIGFAAYLFFLTRRRNIRLSSTLAWQVIGGDLAWVIASLVALPVWGHALTSTGQLAVGTVAGIVALFAILQTLHLIRRTKSESSQKS